MLEANASLAFFSPCNTHSRSPHDHVKVHTEDTDTRIISRTKIDVLLNTETKVARVRKVLPSQLVLLYFETTFEDLLGFGSTDGDVDSDFFVSTDTKGTDGVSGFGGHGRLAGQLFQHFGCTGQAITRFTDTDVCSKDTGSVSLWCSVIQHRRRERTDDELLDSELFHGVGWGRLLLGLSKTFSTREMRGIRLGELAMAVVVSALSCCC